MKPTNESNSVVAALLVQAASVMSVSKDFFDQAITSDDTQREGNIYSISLERAMDIVEKQYINALSRLNMGSFEKT